MPSIALSVRVGTNSGGTGSNRCFYSGPRQPITPEADPYKMYDRLFAGRPATPMPGMPADPDPADKLRAERKSLLDFVGGSLEKFGRQIGTEDRVLIEGHLESIRTLEKSLTAPRPMLGACGLQLTGDASQAARRQLERQHPHPARTSSFQIMTAALKCDATRVATLQFGDATGGAVTFPFVGRGPQLAQPRPQPRRRQDQGRRLGA